MIPVDSPSEKSQLTNKDKLKKILIGSFITLGLTITGLKLAEYAFARGICSNSTSFTTETSFRRARRSLDFYSLRLNETPINSLGDYIGVVNETISFNHPFDVIALQFFINEVNNYQSLDDVGKKALINKIVDWVDVREPFDGTDKENYIKYIQDLEIHSSQDAQAELNRVVIGYLDDDCSVIL